MSTTRTSPTVVPAARAATVASGRAAPEAAPAESARAMLRVAQTLLIGPLGALVIFGSVYFGVIAPTEASFSAFDWFVGGWAFAMGVTSIVLGSRLVSGGDPVRRAALGLVALHAVFGVVKLVFYAEAEAATFMAVDAIVAGILLRSRAQAR